MISFFKINKQQFITTLFLLCFFSQDAFSTTLTQALVHAYNNNPQLIAARADVKSSDEAMFQALARFLPSIFYKAKKTYYQTDANTITKISFLENDQHKYVSFTNKYENGNQKTKTKTSSITATQNIFEGGEGIMSVKRAKYIIEFYNAKLVNVEQNVLMSCVNAFFDVILTKNILAISKDYLDSSSTIYNSVKVGLEAGIKKQVDLSYAKANKSDAETFFYKSQAQYNSALANYFRVVGIEADNLIIDESKMLLPSNQIELLQESLRHNPTILQYVYLKKYQDVGVDIQSSKLLPTVTLQGQSSKIYYYQQGRNISQPYTNVKSALINVQVPIYNKGLEYSNVRGQKAVAAQSKYNLKSVKSSVSNEVTKTWSNYQAIKASLKSSKDAVDAELIALDSMKEYYNEGVASITDLVSAQQRLFVNKVTHERVKNNFENIKYKLSLLAGQLNAKALNLPTKIYNPAANYDNVKLKLIGF
jgi:outer membrane protein